MVQKLSNNVRVKHSQSSAYQRKKINKSVEMDCGKKLNPAEMHAILKLNEEHK